MLRRALVSPRLWLLSVILWAIPLFLLSSLPATPHVDGPEIPHMDKVMHFVYFMGGAFLFATHQLLKYGRAAHAMILVATPILLFALIGALDEYHQTFTPGRSETTLSTGSPISSEPPPEPSSPTDFLFSNGVARKTIFPK
jgi:VanZ family protein